MRNNMALAQLFKLNMKALGREMMIAMSGSIFGSTDFGNVSQVVPGIQPLVAMAPAGVRLHSPQFAQAAASELAMKGLADAAKALAMTVADLLSEPANMRKVKQEFTGN
jgi:metal-dependent amidase/aminoacylase/carboxypeptidase family protein